MLNIYILKKSLAKWKPRGSWCSSCVCWSQSSSFVLPCAAAVRKG